MQNDTPRITFIHLLAFIMLYVSVVSLIVLNFQYIDVAFPDRLDFVYTEAFEQVRFAGSILAVAFAVYLGLSWFLHKEVFVHPDIRQTRVRKWLVALTLFAAALTIIIDLITLLYRFWGGELTSRFFLKTALVLAVAAAVFGYFIWDSRRDIMHKTALPKLFAMGAGLLVLACIGTGFFVVGTPQEQRLRRFDEQRVHDLQMLQSNIISYWQTKETLPSSLDEMATLYSVSLPADPETQGSYEYRIVDDLSFEICATFVRSNKEFAERVKKNALVYAFDFSWVHDAGRVCFSKTIDPDLYPTQRDPYPYMKEIPLPARAVPANR